MARLSEEIFIGVDVGGTHTDLAVASGGQILRSKAFTTHGDYSEGIENALKVMAENLGVSLKELLEKCSYFVNGTTIVTNSLTELRGSKVGILITKGFKDTFHFARGARRNEYDDHVQENPPDVVSRDCIIEIDERVNSKGEILVSINERQVRQAVAEMRTKGVEAIAVCFLWSFKNNAHELRAKELIAEEFPTAFVTASAEIHPVIREYERFMTAVFNCFCYKATTGYLQTIGKRLRNHGFKGQLSFFQGIGGCISEALASKFPVFLLASGPAGGVMGANYLAEKMGISNLLIADMGGTSLDTALIENNQPRIANKIAFGEMETGINIVDVISVGSGGGSIAWLDSRAVPQVGPQSAGSYPGPASYGLGGTEPTVTDAMLRMGFMDPENYLGGRYKLDVSAANKAISNRLGESFKSVEEASAGIHDLVVATMSNALREVTIERGHDPREFILFAYGGTLPLFAANICKNLNIKRIVIPHNSAVFSAFGLLTADFKRRYDRTVNWNLSQSDDFQKLNGIIAEMMEQVKSDLATEGYRFEDCEILHKGDFRFQGQVFEVPMPIESTLNEKSAGYLSELFPSVYEKSYGAGTAWVGVPVELVTYSLTVSVVRKKPEITEFASNGKDVSSAQKGTRKVFLPADRDFHMVTIYDYDLVQPGMSLQGPSIIEALDTTIFIPAGYTCQRDKWFNLVLTEND